MLNLIRIEQNLCYFSVQKFARNPLCELSLASDYETLGKRKGDGRERTRSGGREGNVRQTEVTKGKHKQN